MKEWSCQSVSEEATHALGKRLAGLLPKKAFVALCGELGAGKTHLAQGVGDAMGVFDMKSPTFSLIAEYWDGALIHIDSYRLRNEEELYNLGFDDYLAAPEGVVLMEWADLVAGALPAERLDIWLSGSGNEPRTIRFVAHGAAYEQILAQLSAAEDLD